MNREFEYAVEVEWTGNTGQGTADRRSFGRQHVVRAEGKHEISGSSDVPFRGDADRWNPEELLLTALSQCHMLSYLHVAASNGVVVTAYSDQATGTMQLTGDGGGRFTSVTLRPQIRIAAGPDGADASIARAQDLHAEAAAKCFIAASVNFPVTHEPHTTIGSS